MISDFYRSNPEAQTFSAIALFGIIAGLGNPVVAPPDEICPEIGPATARNFAYQFYTNPDDTLQVLFTLSVPEESVAVAGIAFRSLAAIVLPNSREMTVWEKEDADEFFWSEFS